MSEAALSEAGLPTPSVLLGRARMLDTAVSLPSMLVIVIYLQAVLEMSASEWIGFGTAMAIYGVLIGCCAELMRRRMYAPLVSFLTLSRDSDREVAMLQVRREAFAKAIVLPRQMMRITMAQWILAAALIPFCSWLFGFGSWGFDYRLVVLFSAGAFGGIVSCGFLFFGTKRIVTDLRMALATALPDPVERASLIQTTSIPRKVQFVVLGAVVGTSLLTISLAHSRATRAIQNSTLSWQERMLDAVEPALQQMSIEEAVASVIWNPSLLPHPIDIAVLDPRWKRAAGQERTLVIGRIAEAQAAGEDAGRLAGGLFPDVVAWREISDGRVLIATVRGGALAGTFADFHLFLAAALLLSAGISLCIAYLLASDMSVAAEYLTADAARMAEGDLRPGAVWESEDEMGSLARGFELMGAALRATVGRVSEAADRVDTAAGEISRVSQSVAVASADQVRRIQQANELMVQITQQVSEVSSSAEELNMSVEESSSSILEIGAASDELNDTASVLSTKVEEVSESIEEMTRSVKQVGITTASLSEAATDTSSSMEEMASSMRVVDTSAETTADLSRNVVSLAETGQQKVSQTINGMQAISDATGAAEKVIRGLGAHAKEIGGILDVIDDVADETNLLALNAAIIAAQAGEHGRAFSVVADEIKELADRVLSSTKEIGGLIRSVQGESENAIGAIEAGAKSVASGVDLSAEAGTALEEITRASRESGTRIGDIVVAVREQTKATAHVVTLMEGVRDGVEQISEAGSEQDRGNEVVFRSVVTMREVSQQVRLTTEEQTRSFARIRESVEGVRGAVVNINSSLQEQSSACAQVATFLEQVSDGTRTNEEAARAMGESMRGLLEQAEALREDVAKFQI